MSSTLAVETSARALPCWCGGGPWRSQFRTPRFGLVRCEVCSCYRIDPPPISRADESANFYTNYYAGDRPAIAQRAHERTGDYWEALRQVPALGTVKRRALEIGCGDAHRCAQLADAGWPEVIGCDISASRLAGARKLYPCLRLEREPPGDPGSIDLLVMEHIIEHLPDPLAYLRRIRSMMAADGQILLTTPNMASGEFRFLGRFWTAMLAPHAHIFLFTPQTLGLLLRLAGFQLAAAGSLQKPFASPLKRKSLKGVCWQAHQGMGQLAGRLIRCGSIAYAVGRS